VKRDEYCVKTDHTSRFTMKGPNTMRLKILHTIAVVFLVCSILGWGQKRSEIRNPKPEIKNVKKIVVLNSDAVELICALGAEDRVVGITESVAQSGFFNRLKGRPIVGRWNNPNYERIAEVEPEVLIAYGRHPGPELEEKLEPLGIKVVRMDCYKIGSLCSEVKTLGIMLGKEKEADELVNFYQRYLRLVGERVKQLKSEERVRVYVESYSDFTSVARGSGGHQMCITAGGVNIAAEEPVPYPKISPEWVLEENPQVVVKAVTPSLAPCGYGVEDTKALTKLREKIMSRPGWPQTDAVKNSRVYLISADIWTGPQAFIGIAYMAKWLYPERFRDLHPESVHKEYLKRFFGLKYRGIFVWP